MGRWHRVGNFYKMRSLLGALSPTSDTPTPWGRQSVHRNPVSRLSVFRDVEFRSNTGSVSAIYIAGYFDVCRQRDRTIEITIKSHGKTHEIIQDILYAHQHVLSNFSLPGMTIIWRGKSGRYFSFNELNSLLTEINEKTKEAIFTDELIEELKQLGEFSSSEQFNRQDEAVINKHYINEDKPTIPLAGKHLNPERLFSTDLSKILYKGIPHPDHLYFKNKLPESYLPTNALTPLSKEDEREIEELLIHGENPNQRDSYGVSPIIIAILFCQNIAVVELLLRYYANPFDRANGADHISAIDIACHANSKEQPYLSEVYSLIVSANTKFDKSPPVTVNKTSIFRRDNVVHTEFEFSDGELIKTALKPNISGLVTPEETLSIVEMSKASFMLEDDADKKKITQATLEDISTPGAIIEIIKNKQNTTIGFNIFKIIDNNVLYCSYSIIDPKYRGYGLMTLLAFRPAYLLERFSDKPVAVFYLAVSYYSYRLAEKLPHYPMFQTPDLNMKVDELVKKVADGAMPYRNSIMCYVTGQIILNPTLTKISAFHEKYFYNRILGHASEGKAAPVLYFIGKESFEQLNNICSKLNINLLDHISQLTKSAQPLINHHLNGASEKRTFTLVSSGATIWQYKNTSHAKETDKNVIKKSMAKL